MPIPSVSTETDEIAKEFFGRKASVSVKMGKCVSCRADVRLLQYTKSERVPEYEEYKRDGLCIFCNDELSAPTT